MLSLGNMDTDTLDRMSDDQLNEVFALEVAESHERMPADALGSLCWDDQQNYRNKHSGEIFGLARAGDAQIGTGCWPAFCSKMGAVIPSLEKYAHCELRRTVTTTAVPPYFLAGWCALITLPTLAGVGVGSPIGGVSTNMARAAVLALIRARRAQAKIAVG